MEDRNEVYLRARRVGPRQSGNVNPVLDLGPYLEGEPDAEQTLTEH